MEVKTEKRFRGTGKVAQFMDFLDSLKEPIVSDSELREIFKKALSFIEPGTLIITPKIFDEIIMITTYLDSIAFITRGGLRIQFYVYWSANSVLVSVTRVEEDHYEN
jgi:hypothetical protein